MPVELDTPVEPVVLGFAKIVALKVEDNVEHWAKVWVSYGTMVDDQWVEYCDPTTGNVIPPKEYHLEDGHHPLAQGTSLRLCPSCGLWWGLETECSCGEGTVPYDGFSRLASSAPVGGSIYSVIRDSLYTFLTSELVPNPLTGEVEPLLATV